MPTAANDRPPAAERRPREMPRHDGAVVDDYAWLRDRDDPAVRAYLEAENAHTEASLAHTESLQERLYAEIKGRVQETDVSAPVHKRGWWYYTRTLEGSQYAIHCRARDAEGSGEQVLLDENALAEGLDYFALGGFAISPDQRLLAYATDTTGDEILQVHLRDLDTGEEWPDVIERAAYGLAWANDNATLFYPVQDEALRPYQLWRHRLDGSDDEVVFEEPDGRFYLGVGRTRSDAFVVCQLHSKVTSEAWVLDADEPAGEFRCVTPRRQDVEYDLDHAGDRFYLVANDAGAVNFRLVAAPVDDPTAWREVIGHREDVMLAGVDCFAGHLVCYERADAVTRIRVVPLADGEPDLDAAFLIDQPEAVSAAFGAANPEFDTPVLRYAYTSLVTPPSAYDYDVTTGERTLVKQRPVLGGFDPADYETHREWASAPDGTAVPISLVARRGVARDGTSPCLVYGYGAYGMSMDPAFSSARLSLLDRGVVFAIAHVRGGGELGRRWYEAGKYTDKPNTFSDFIACAEQLVDAGWADPDRLALRGGSAGGLLVGAVLNARPERFRAAVAEVPFVDILSTMHDETLPLTVIEYEEWGNPAEPRYGEVMGAYSPYDNVRAVRYPDLLVTAGLNDPRVGYWEPAKWVAKLRAVSPDSRVLLKTELGAGHAGPSGRYKAWREEALVQAFLLDALDVT